MNKLKTITLSLVILFSFLLLDVSYAYVFNYRYTITINNTQNPNDLTDYPVKVRVNTWDLIYNGYMEDDCSDIRFSESADDWSLNEGLPYWIESGCNTGATVIWIKVPLVPGNSTKKIYMYFGNSSAPSYSNGERVFTFFDGFDTSSLNTSKWTFSGYDYYLTGNTLRLFAPSGDVYSQIRSTELFLPSDDIILEFRSSLSPAQAGSRTIQGFYNFSKPSYGVLKSYGTTDLNFETYYPYSGCGLSLSWPSGYQLWGITHLGGDWYLYKNYGYIGDCFPGTTLSHIYFYVYNYSYLYIDFVRIRKFSRPEPKTSVNYTLACNPDYCYAACGASTACEGRETSGVYTCENEDGCQNTKGEPSTIPYKSKYICTSDCSAYDADYYATVCAIVLFNTITCPSSEPCWSIGGSHCLASRPDNDGQYSAYGCNEYCCGDDPNEYRINTSVVNTTEFQNFTWSNTTDMYGCCNSSSSCVYDDKCYFQGSANGMIGDAVCISNDTGSYWIHGDDDSNACLYTCSVRNSREEWFPTIGGNPISYCLAKTWAPGGEINEVPYGYGDRCCGDDNFNGIREVLTISKVLNQSSFNSFNSNGDFIACCNLSSKCAYNDRCYPNLTLVGDALCFNNFTHQDWSIVLDSSAGGSYWVNVDDYEWACSLANLDWISNSSRFESGNPYCCGDDLNEYSLYRNCEIESQCTTDINDRACCDSASDCVYNGVCYSSGSCYSIDGMKLYCLDGKWIDLDKNRSYCEACNYTWLSNESIGLCCGDDLTNDNFGIVNYSYCLYCKGGSSYSSDLLYYQGSLVGRCDYNSLMYNCSSGFYYNLSSYYCYYQVSCSSDGWEAIALDSFCPRNNSIYYETQDLWIYEPSVGWYNQDIRNITFANKLFCYLSTSTNGFESCNATTCSFLSFNLFDECKSQNCKFHYDSLQEKLVVCDRDNLVSNYYNCSNGWNLVRSYDVSESSYECEHNCLMKYIVSDLANQTPFESFSGTKTQLYACCPGANYCSYNKECYSNLTNYRDAICLVNSTGSYWYDIDDSQEFCDVIGGNWSNLAGSTIVDGFGGNCCGDDIGLSKSYATFLDTWENNESGASWCCCGGRTVVNATLDGVPQTNVICDYDGDDVYELICVNGKYVSCIDSVSGATGGVAEADELVGKYFCNSSIKGWQIAPTEAQINVTTDKTSYNIPDDTEVLISFSVTPTQRSVVKVIEGTARIYVRNSTWSTLIYEDVNATPFSGSISYDISWIRVEGDYEILGVFTYENEEKEEVNATSIVTVHITPLRRINITILEPSFNESFDVNDTLTVKVNLNNTGVFDENVTLKIIVHDPVEDHYDISNIEVKVGENKNYTYTLPISSDLCVYNLKAFDHLIEVFASYDSKQAYNSTTIYVEPYINISSTVYVKKIVDGVEQIPPSYGSNELVNVTSSIDSCSNFDILLDVVYEFENIDANEIVDVVSGCSGGNLVKSSSTKDCDFSWDTNHYEAGKYNITMKLKNESLNLYEEVEWSFFKIEEEVNVSISLNLDKDSYAEGETMTVVVNLANLGNVDVYSDPTANTGKLTLTIYNSQNQVVDSWEKTIVLLPAGSSESYSTDFYIDPSKPYTTTNEIIAKFNFTYDDQHYEVSDEKEFIVGSVAVDIIAPEDKSSFFAYPEETVDFLVHVTTVNLTTGEVIPLDYASASDFYVYDNYTNSYSLINFNNLGDGNYSFSIGIENKGSYRIYVRVKDPESDVAGESYVDISIVVHKVTIKLVGLNGTNLYIPNKTIIDVEISPMTDDYLITKEELRDRDYYIFVYRPSFLLGLFFDPSYRGDLSYVRFDSPSTAGYNLSISLDYKGNSFLLVFTRGSKYLAISRYDLLKEDRFFSLVNPSFGFRIKDYVNVKLVYDLSEYNLNLTSEELKLPPGLYKFKIKNIGLVEGKVGIEVRRV